MFSDGATALTTFQYDAFGNVTRAEDRNGQVKVYAYDELLRLRTELWYDEQGQLANTITRTYDAANRVVDLVDDVSHYTYVYDSLDRVVQETIANPGAPTVVLNTGYGDVGQGYRLDGLRTSSSVEIAGTADYVATFAYNALNQLTEISQAGQGGSAVAGKHVSLTYTDTGLIESVTRYASTDASNLVVIGDYTYDAQGRLTALSYYQDPANPLNEYTWAYDAAGRLIRQTSSDGSADYAYDASGQVTAADYDYQADESYQYDENGNRTSADGAAYQTDEHNRMTSDGAYAYTYDDEGNRTARFLDNDLSGDLSDGDTDITQYAWDAANRLAGVAFRDTYDGPVAKTLTYTYDAYSRLIRKTVDPDGQQGTADLLQTAYVYDGDQIVLQFDRTGGGDVQASDLSHRYLWGPAVDQILADETVGDGGSDDVLWPLTDHQGTVRDLAFYDEADAETSIANHVAYNAFGRKTSETNAAVDCVFAYTGRLLDDDTDLQNHLHRWYDPATAKWLSEDPIGFEAGDANLTRWVGNAGTTGVDPDGLAVIWVLENVSHGNPNAAGYEASAPGARSDVLTRCRVVPALEYVNPNAKGAPFVCADAVDPYNPSVLIDRKWSVIPKSDAVAKFRGNVLEALRQNQDCSLRIEVPNQKGAVDARRLLRLSGYRPRWFSPQITIEVVPPGQHSFTELEALARARLYEGVTPRSACTPIRTTLPEAYGSASLAGFWIVGTICQFQSLGSATNEIEEMKSNLKVAMNPMIWPLLYGPSPLSMTANRINGQLTATLEDHNDWINWVRYSHQCGQTVGEDAMRRARAYIEGQAALIHMGYTGGMKADDVYRFRNLYNNRNAWQRAVDRYLGEEPGCR